MKKIFKYILYSIVAITASACGDLYETHEKYLTEGEETYIGIPDTLIANGGFRRIELKWKLNADSRISKSIITWNGCLEPLEIPVDHSKEFMSTIINMEEGKYIFQLVNVSETAKKSLPQIVSGEVYGENYQSRLPQRGISSMSAAPIGITINWASEEGCIGTNLIYTNKDNESKTLFISEEESSTLIADYIPGSEFSVISMFKPELNAIDNISSLEGKFSFPDPDYFVVSKTDWDNMYHADYTDLDCTGWTIEASTEELTGELSTNSGPASRIIDGNPDTFWHTQWQGEGKNPPLPHEIIIDMQTQQDIMSVELYRRRIPNNNKDTKTVVFSISDDKDRWKEIGLLDFPNAVDPNVQILLLPKPVSGRYFRAMVTASNNGANASIGEIMFTTSKRE